MCHYTEQIVSHRFFTRAGLPSTSLKRPNRPFQSIDHYVVELYCRRSKTRKGKVGRFGSLCGVILRHAIFERDSRAFVNISQSIFYYNRVRMTARALNIAVSIYSLSLLRIMYRAQKGSATISLNFVSAEKSNRSMRVNFPRMFRNYSQIIEKRSESEGARAVSRRLGQGFLIHTRLC